MDLETRRQLDALTFDERPLIVCDVDEVILHFVRPLEDFFVTRGYRLKEKRFKLTGNVIAIEDNHDAPDETVFAMIHDFFEHAVRAQEIVDGAVRAMAKLSENAEVVFLTNIPHQFRDARTAYLREKGLHHPLITNRGAKGPALAHLLDVKRNAAVWFIDDSPQNHHSVAEHAPEVHLVHFVADPEFLELADHVPSALLRTNCWSTTVDLIERQLEGRLSGAA